MSTEQPTIHQRLSAILAEVKAITKERKNDAQNFKFRGVDDVYNELHGLFAKHGVYVVPLVQEHAQTERATARGGTQLHAVVKMRYRFTAADGSHVEADAPGEAADSGDKGLGKACQYAYKLLLLQMFLIPTEGDNDPDAGGTEWAGGEDWIKRIVGTRSEAELDALLDDLRAAADAGRAPPSDSAAGTAITEALAAQRDKLARRRAS